MENTKTKKPMYKNKWVIIIAILVLVGIILFGKKEENDSTPNPIKKENVSIPKSIELGEVTMLSEGYKVSCAFYKDLEYIKVKGKLKVEVYNWEMSDNVKYTDADTYSLGLKLAEQEFSITPSQLKEETIAFKFEDVIKTVKKPSKTYLSAKFIFTPDSDTSVQIVGGSSYQTL